MKVLTFLLLLCLPVNTSWAQTKPVTLTGTLAVNTGETFPFRLVLTEKDGIVKGHSYTYAAPNDTKTAIEGTLDRRTHTLTFKETEIIYSHDVRTKAYMCLVDAKLTYNISKENALKGPITSMQADKTSCTGGLLTFTNSDEIQFLFAYHDKPDTVITMGKKPKPAATEEVKPVEEEPQQQQPVATTDKITAGIEKTYEWRTDTVVIDIWDGGTTDGDRVTLQLNGKDALTKYYLVKQSKQLRLPLAPGTNILSILAENEGNDPPNTATLRLTDGRTHYSVLAYNIKNQVAIIKIKRVTK